MTLTMYWYPNCGTCKKAKKWLDDHEIDYQTVHLVNETPTENKLKELIEKSGLQQKKFFNTRGKVYHEENMKYKIKEASIELMVSYVASYGMIIKRLIVTNGEKVIVGFNESTFEESWNN